MSTGVQPGYSKPGGTEGVTPEAPPGIIVITILSLEKHCADTNPEAYWKKKKYIRHLKI